jgi:hypothetical protein
LAIALSSANPFLLIAAGLHLTSGIRALLNDSATIKFRTNINTLLIEFSVDAFNIQRYIATYSIQNEIKKYSLKNNINEYLFPVRR